MSAAVQSPSTRPLPKVNDDRPSRFTSNVRASSPGSPRLANSTTSSESNPPPLSASRDEPEVPEEGSKTDPSFINMETFTQILELDDEGDESHEFSRGMVDAYYEQAEATFTKMNKAYESKDLAELSSLGHFLKGSSAALGVSKVSASCENIQHYGSLRDEETNTDLTSKEALSRIGRLLDQVKKEHEQAKEWLDAYFGVLSED